MPSRVHVPTLYQALATMGFKTRLIVALAALALLQWLGWSAFSSCYAHGGNFLSCGLVAFFIGGMKAVLFVYFLFWALLIDGIAHLFGNS